MIKDFVYENRKYACNIQLQLNLHKHADVTKQVGKCHGVLSFVIFCHLMVHKTEKSVIKMFGNLCMHLANMIAIG